MDCRIEFSDGSILNVPGVDNLFSWFDLFETLLDLGEISESQYEEAEVSLDFDDEVQPNISFRTGTSPQPIPGRKPKDPRRRLGSKDLEVGGNTRPERGAKKPSSGLKKKSSPIPRPSPIPTPKRAVSGGMKRKISRQKQPMVSNRTYSMPLKCSRDRSDWSAILISQHKPIKFDGNLLQTSSKGKFGASIHLVLDDSGSMDGAANQQLKYAAIAFLAERPRGENIVLHTINQSLSGSGPPSQISSLVSRLACLGLTPMCACLNRVSSSVSKGDVIIFFTDGDSTDGNPTNITESIKSRDVRFISIGCGHGVEKSLLQNMASSRSDYHHANSASGILQAFQAVAKSLSQRQIVHSSSGSKSGSTIVARQVQSQGYSASSSSSGYGSGSSVLADNEGFEFIEEFKCHHCSSTQRIACGYCGKNMCSGGAKGGASKGSESTITCPYCSEVSEVEVTQKGVHVGVGKLGGKKGK